MNENLGIVLSGGGVRGVAHIGLLQALSENNIHPQVISGTSAGALVGALYAAGYEAKDMLTFFKTTPLFGFSFYATTKPGLLDSEKYRQFFEQYFPEDNFSALYKRLFIGATDIAHARGVLFEKDELIRPLLASAALPPLFTPVEINNTLYVDGGIMDNFPVEPLTYECNRIIGSYVNPVSKLSKKYFTNSAKVFRRAADLRLYADSQFKFSQCEYVFEPQELSKFGLLDTKQIDAIFNIGYETACRDMESILKAIQQPTESFKPFEPNQQWGTFSMN